MQEFERIIKEYNKPTQKKLKKIGTIAVDIVETTPIVWKDRLYRFEWYRNWKVGRRAGWYHFVDMETGDKTAPFAHSYAFGAAYTENDTMYVVGTKFWGANVIDMFVSKDLTSWETYNVLTLPENWECYNTSLCKGKDGYVMAIEIGGPKEIAGVPFTIVFARSKDLKNWEMLDATKYVHTKDRYSACPVIRYSDGYYYMIYLEAFPFYKFAPYIARSADLLEWEIAPVNPVLFYCDEDKVLCGDFTDEEKEYINTALNTNNSDVDLCEFNGKTVILYSWGNQSGREFLAKAEYDGTMDEFFKSFF